MPTAEIEVCIETLLCCTLQYNQTTKSNLKITSTVEAILEFLHTWLVFRDDVLHYGCDEVTFAAVYLRLCLRICCTGIIDTHIYQTDFTTHRTITNTHKEITMQINAMTNNLLVVNYSDTTNLCE